MTPDASAGGFLPIQSATRAIHASSSPSSRKAASLVLTASQALAVPRTSSAFTTHWSCSTIRKKSLTSSEPPILNCSKGMTMTENSLVREAITKNCLGSLVNSVSLS